MIGKFTLFLRKKFSWQFKVAFASSLCKLVMIACNIATIRIISDRLGIEYYAIYTILVNLVGWFALTDLGISSSMQNFISEKRALSMPYDKYIANAFYLTLFIAIGVSVSCYLASPLVGQIILKSILFIGHEDKLFYLRTVLFIFSANFIVAIAYRIWLAEKKVLLINLWLAASSLFSLSLMLTLNWFDKENRLNMALLFAIVPNLLIHLFLLSRRLSKISLANLQPSIEVGKQLFERGRGFWMLSLLGVVSLNIDSIIVANKMPPEFIVVYAFCARIYSNVFNFYSQLLQAAWPVFSESLVMGKRPYIKHKLRLYITYGILGLAFFTLAMCLLLPYITSILLPKLTYSIPISIVLLFGLWYIVRLWSDTHGIVLFISNKTKILNTWSIIFLVLNVTLQLALIPFMGGAGIVAGAVLAYVLTVVWYYPIQSSKILNH